MTVKQAYEGVLIDTNKVSAPPFMLEEFNYMLAKAINMYINKEYTIYDMGQQQTDNLRMLKATAILPVKSSASEYGEEEGIDSLYGATYETVLPNDYLHILNCICDFIVKKPFKCYNVGRHVQFPAARLTSDMWSQIIRNAYTCPIYKRPYYFLHNVNTSTTNPTNPYSTETGLGTDVTATLTDGKVKITGGLPKTIKIGGGTLDAVERTPQVRYGNTSAVRLEIRYGKDNTVFELNKVLVDYIKTPQTYILTQEQLDLTEDTSQIMEFPDYVCQEIINELNKLVLENQSDPRLQTYIPVNNSIANPAQATEKPKK